MPFNRVFERTVNKNMQEGDPGPSTHMGQVEEADIKKHSDAKGPSYEEEDDQEMSEKKDHPPRFSQLFAPSPSAVVLENPPPPRKRKSGVFIPTPLFIVLAVIVLLESTFLFAYTIIGLYSQLPSQLLGVAGLSPAPINGVCNCGQQDPAINIAPKFYLAGTATTALAEDVSSPASTTTTSTSKSKPHTIKVVTYTPPPATVVTSTKIETTTPSPSTKPRSTVYATVNADGSTLPTLASTETKNADTEKRASIASALSGAKEGLSPKPSLSSPQKVGDVGAD